MNNDVYDFTSAVRCVVVLGIQSSPDTQIFTQVLSLTFTIGNSGMLIIIEKIQEPAMINATEIVKREDCDNDPRQNYYL